MATVVKFKAKGGALKLDQSYNFVEKAAIIDRLRTEIEDGNVTLTYVANKSGVCESTLRNWFNGQTMRPQFPTLNAVGKLFGLKLDWVKR